VFVFFNAGFVFMVNNIS